MKTKREYKSIFRILSHGRVGLFVSGVLASLFCANNAYALPQGGQLKDGQATISLPSSTQMNINQASNRAIIDWQSFNIAANEKLNIVQPSSNAMLLSRVVGNDPSKIFGQVTANGGLMLINQNGILFGKGSKVDVAALVASTANIKNEDFMAGKMRFMTPSNPNAKIINEGTITAKDGGLVALVAPYVQNNGFIIAKYGTVAIAGANTATIDLYGDNLIVFETPDELKKTIENSGTIEAGYVAMSISDAKKVVDSSINMSGIIKAQNIDTSGGKVVLTGGNINLSGTIEAIGANGDGGNVKVVADMNSGTLDFGGKIDISSQNGNGGFAETSGNSVKISNTASVNAKGKKYGEWLIDPNDYTILADGTGDITGAALSASLENANVTISTTTQGHSGNGDIFVYDNIIWNANTILSLNAEREIHINNDITAHGNTAEIVLNPAINFFFYDGAKINLDGSNPTVNIRGQNYTVITALNTVDQLRTLSTGGNMNGYYVLAVDINTWAPPGQTVNMLPIGTSSNPFNGTFEGFGHTINGMQVNNSGNNTPTGMFGRIGENGFVRNLTISNPTVVGGTVDGVGALAGINNGGIEYVVIDGGSVTSSTNMTGGLVGFNNNISHPAQIFNSGSTATVTSSGDNVGGLVGASIDSILGNVYAEGAVTGHDTVGGLVGGLWAASGSSSLINAYATGNVTGNYLVGGLVGETSTYTTISNAYSDGDVTGGYKVGGLIGESSGTVSNTYATGDVYASRGAVGGLIGGMMEGSVTRSFAVGNVSTAGNNPVSVSDGNGGTVTVYPVDAGGFVGTMENGSISQSWSSGNVEITKVGGMYGGGFVGHMWAGSIADSKSHGNVTTRGDYTGGFAGELTSGSVVRVLATGTVFTTGAHVGGVYGYIRFAPSNSMFYDQDTVGNVVGINDGGIGKTTAQLKNAATFVGWDIDTTNTDPNRVWTIYDPSEYPGLHSTGYSMVDGYVQKSAPNATVPSSNSGSSSGGGSVGGNTVNSGSDKGKDNETNYANVDINNALTQQTRQNMFVEVFNEIKTPEIENKLQDRVTAMANSYDAMNGLLSKPAITSSQAEAVLPYLQLLGSSIPSNFKQLADVSEKVSGLDANVFYDSSSKKLVITFAGTEDRADIKTNMGIEFNEGGIAKVQFEEALRLFNLIKDKPKVKELLANGGTIEVAGYSIGGALAEYVGAMTGAKAYAFNPAAVPDGIYSASGRDTSNVVIVRSALDTVSSSSMAYGSEHLSSNIVNVPGLNTLGDQHSVDDLIVGLKNATTKTDAELKNELASLQDKVRDKDSETSKIVTAKLEDSLNKPVYGSTSLSGFAKGVGKSLIGATEIIGGHLVKGLGETAELGEKLADKIGIRDDGVAGGALGELGQIIKERGSVDVQQGNVDMANSLYGTNIGINEKTKARHDAVTNDVLLPVFDAVTAIGTSVNIGTKVYKEGVSYLGRVAVKDLDFKTAAIVATQGGKNSLMNGRVAAKTTEAINELEKTFGQKVQVLFRMPNELALKWVNNPMKPPEIKAKTMKEVDYFLNPAGFKNSKGIGNFKGWLNENGGKVGVFEPVKPTEAMYAAALKKGIKKEDLDDAFKKRVSNYRQTIKDRKKWEKTFTKDDGTTYTYQIDKPTGTIKRVDFDKKGNIVGQPKQVVGDYDLADIKFADGTSLNANQLKLAEKVLVNKGVAMHGDATNWNTVNYQDLQTKKELVKDMKENGVFGVAADGTMAIYKTK